MKVIIADLDGTLFDHSHRTKNLDIGFDEYNSLLHLDEPIHGVCEILRAMYKTHIIIIITGRPEQYREATVDKLFKHMVPYHHLYMRPTDDMRSDTMLKADILNRALEHIDAEENAVDLILEDRNCVVDMWRRMGFTCLQVNNFEIKKESLNVKR